MLDDVGKFACRPLILRPSQRFFMIDPRNEKDATTYCDPSNIKEKAMRYLIGAVLAAATLVPVAHAQTVSGISQTNQAGVTTTLFSVQPQRQVSAADYVKMSADALNYRISASEIALRKAERADVKAYAKADLAEAKKQQASLFAALSNKDRKINKPTLTLSSKRAASIDLLKKSKDDFDNLYLTQMAEEAPSIWALQKGYSLEGSDPALRQVATLWVPTVEASYTAAKGLTPAAVASR
jgi:putative membrane protein